MKFLFLLSLAIVTSLTSCETQKNLIEIREATCGNTGLRGIQPKDKQGNPIDIKGNDYFKVFIKANKRITVEVVSLVAKGMDGTTNVMTPVFTEGGKKHTIEAGKIAQLRAEKDDKSLKAVPLTSGNGILTLKIGRKTYTYLVKEFNWIVPK
jgi:hypothetical protein